MTTNFAKSYFYLFFPEGKKHKTLKVTESETIVVPTGEQVAVVQPSKKNRLRVLQFAVVVYTVSELVHLLLFGVPELTDFLIGLALSLVLGGIADYFVQRSVKKQQQKELTAWPEDIGSIYCTGLGAYKLPGADAIGGQLYLTAKRLEHRPNLHFVQRGARAVYVPLADIDKVNFRHNWFLAKDKLVLHVGRQEIVFLVENGQQWKEEIEGLLNHGE